MLSPCCQKELEIGYSKPDSQGHRQRLYRCPKCLKIYTYLHHVFTEVKVRKAEKPFFEDNEDYAHKTYSYYFT
jgi:hypothetical protein